MITESTMGIGRAARLLGNIVQTLQRWEHNDEAWTCAGCAAHHDCDVNAAVNLQRSPPAPTRRERRYPWRARR